MREIKFRCWDIVNKKMRNNKDLWDIPYNEIFIHTPDQSALNIMQYTGLKDKNGVEIYEGDIIRGVSNRYKSNKITLYVRWDRGQYDVFDIHDKDDWMDSLYNHMNFYDIEVIGNIYENPELLGGE